MRALDDLLFRLRALLGRRSMERELDEELRFHLEMETEKLVRLGLSQEAARRAARRKFGSPRRHKDRAREAWGLGGLRDLQADVQLVFRQLRRNPAFAAAAILTLGLGIGANTAIFSIAEGTLLRSPPVAQPDELVAVYTTCRRGFPKCSSSYPDYVDYRDWSRALEDLEAYSSVPLNLGHEDVVARRLTGTLVTGGYFGLLGTGARLGRPIQPSDNERGSPAQVAVISHDVWSDAFGADREIVGREIRLNGAAYRVVGVAPEGFRGLDLNLETDVWLPIFSAPALGPSAGAAAGDSVLYQRGNRWIGTLIGRLAPGATAAQLQAEMDALASALGASYPEERAAMDGPRGITVDPLGGYILPLGDEAALRRFVGMLFGVVGLTLLLGAANLANLLLARATARSREIGVRLALGAGRGRLIRQLLTESSVLAVVGAAAGLLVARGLLALLGSFELPGGVAIGGLEVGLDGRVLLFALLLSAVTAVAFGLIPALRATRLDLVSSLKGERSEAGGAGQGRLRKTLVAVQMALCLVLLVGAGLFIRTMRDSLDSDLGFRADDAIAARFNLALLRYEQSEAVSFIEELLRRVRGLPGVRSASVATLVPFQLGGFRGTFAEIDGYEPAPEEEIRLDYVLVESGYFDALGTRVIEGRGFGGEDVEGTRQVAVINRHMAQRYWPGSSPIGGSVQMAGQTFEVVGVVEDPVWRTVGEEATPFIFLPLAQHPSFATDFLTLVARTEADPAGLLAPIRVAFRSADPELSLTYLRTMEEQVGIALMPQRMGATLLTLFAGLALVLAAVGIYGVVSYGVRRRAHDIGVRIAVGATAGRIMGEVVSDMAVPIGLGLLAGLAAALALSSTIDRFLFGVSPNDPVTFGAIALLLLTVALVATLIPARTATKLDPRSVLIQE